jgi:hypothetical protein
MRDALEVRHEGNTLSLPIGGNKLALSLKSSGLQEAVAFRLYEDPHTHTVVVCPLATLLGSGAQVVEVYGRGPWEALLPVKRSDDPKLAPSESPTQLLPEPLSLSEEDSLLLDNWDGPSHIGPSEGKGRPLTATTSDRLGSPGVVMANRPNRREGLGRPKSATPSDKSGGRAMSRPLSARPSTATPRYVIEGKAYEHVPPSAVFL